MKRSVVGLCLAALAASSGAAAADQAITPRQAAKFTRSCMVKAGVPNVRFTDRSRGILARFPGRVRNGWGYRWASVSYSSAGQYGVIAAKTSSGDLTLRQRRLWRRCTDVVD